MKAIGTRQTPMGVAGHAPINGLSMYYEFAGAGRPAVYIHPFISFGGVHGYALPAYIQTHRWLSMDLQGHGRTPDIDRPLSFEQEADDVAPETILPIIGRFFNTRESSVPFATTLSGYHPGETR